MRKLKMGMIGIGVGGTEMLPAMEAMPELELMAGADLNPTTLERFEARYGARTYTSAEDLCLDPDVEAVWVSSPNRFHAQHAILAANHGKHVVVEKPMAITLEDAQQMIEAADKNGVKLLAGHTRSFTMPIRAMRRVIQSGKIGRVRAIHLFAYTDWMLRPRTPDELDVNQGGGLPYRQVPHQMDTVRLLGGGMLETIRGSVGQWMPERPIPGYYSAHMEFTDGTPSSIEHDGYGYFIGAELVKWGHSNQRYTPEQRVEVRRQMMNGARDEEADKQSLRIGGDWERKVFQADNKPSWVPEDLGLLIVSCDRGVMRHSERGIYVYDNDGVHDIELEPDRPMGPGQRRAELEELYDSLVHGKPLWHDGRWGMATLEATLAIVDSAKQRKELRLSHQIPVPDGYDADFKVPGYLD